MSRPVDMSKVERAVIVRLSAIGDVVHTMPIAHALKSAFPHLHLTWVVEDRCEQMVRSNPFVDEIVTVPRHRWRAARRRVKTWSEVSELIRNLRHRRFDLALDMQGLMKSALIAYFCGAPKRYGYHWQREGARFLVRAVPVNPASIHVVQQYLDVARFLGAEPTTVDFGIRVPDSVRDEAARLLAELGVGGEYLVINPSAGKDVKRLPTATVARIVDRVEEVGLPVVLVGHSSDAVLGQEIASSARRPVRSLIGRTDLIHLAAVLKGAKVHLCGDTGSGHIAAALNTPVVSVFGPTDPDRSGPYGQREGVISRYGVGDPMTSIATITADEVWAKLEPFVIAARVSEFC